jgi:hypothetical protein
LSELRINELSGLIKEFNSEILSGQET